MVIFQISVKEWYRVDIMGYGGRLWLVAAGRCFFARVLDYYVEDGYMAIF